MISITRRLAFFMAFALIAASPWASAQPMPEPPTLSAAQFRELLPALRTGGYVFYFRHMSSRHDQEDKNPLDLENCATQRNLSEEGQKQATLIGKAFKKLAIPVSSVFSSPFCRCKETAMLAFGTAKISPDLYFAAGLLKSDRIAKGEALRKMLSTVPAGQHNTVIIAHSANLEEAVGFWPKPEGVAYLFRPGADGLQAIGRLPPELWEAF